MSDLNDLELGPFLRRWWSIMLAALILGGAIGWIVVDRAGGGHETTASLLIGPLSADADVLEGTTDLARTYGEIAESDIVIRQAAEIVGVSPTAIDVAATAESNTPILRIRVRMEERDRAVDATEALISTLTNFVGAELVDSEAIGSFSTNLNGDEIGSEVTILDVSTSPTSLRLPGPVGGAIGAMSLLLIVCAGLINATQRSKPDAAASSIARLGTLQLPATGRSDDLETAIGTDESVANESARAAHSIHSKLAFTGDFAPLLVAISPSIDANANSAFAQLLSGFDQPATVMATAACPAIDGQPARTGMYTADGRVIGHLRVTSNPQDVKGVRRILRMHNAHGLAIVHVAANLADEHLLPWLDVADAAIFLDADQRSGPLPARRDELMTKLDQARVPLLGSVAFTHRRIRSRRAAVQWSADSDWPTTGPRQ